MAIPTFQSASNGASTGTILTMNVAHTVPSSLNNATMLVLVTSPSAASAASATWNGNTMTSIPVTSGNFFMSAFYILNPTSGAHNVTVNWNIFSANICVTIITISDTTIPDVVHTTSGFTGAGTTASDSITTTKANALVVDFVMTDNTVTHIQGTGQTEESNFTAQNTIFRQSTSYKSFVSPGSQTMSITTSANSTDYQMATVSLPPTPSNISNFFLVF